MDISLYLKLKKSKRSSFSLGKQKMFVFYGFISPWIVGFIGLLVIPMVFAIYISFTNFNGFDLAGTSVIGISNYVEAFRNPDAWRTMGLTIKYSVMAIPLGLITALGLSLLLNQKIKGRGLFRTFFYIPTLVPGIASALVFGCIFNVNSGFLNLFLNLFKLPAIDWLNNYGVFCLAIMSIWGCGTMMVIFLAGLQEIPEELQEAAIIDGANKWQTFWNVTWPLLSPITYFQLIMGIIGALQMYVQASMLSQVAYGKFWEPLQSLFVYPSYALSQMMAYQRFGYGAALIWILFIIILLVTLIVQKTSKYWVYYAVDQEGGAKKE